MSDVRFFFFKQKTAYEMRISDWSSDVCSSDLPRHQHVGIRAGIFWLRQIVHADRNAVARVDKAVHARRQYALETTVAIQQAALAVANHDLLDPDRQSVV